MTTIRTDVRGREVIMTYLDKDRWSVEVDGKKLGSRFADCTACILAAVRYASSVPREQSGKP